MTGPASAAADDHLERIVVTHSATYPPFSYIDEGDTPQGYLIDMWRAYGRANHTKIQFKLTSWKETLTNIREGKADVHAGLFFSAERDRFLDFGPDILKVSTALFIPKDNDLSQLNGQAIGVILGGYGMEYMKANYPSHELTNYSDTKALVKAAVDGEITAFVADVPTASHYLRLQGTTERFPNRKTLYTMPLRTAVRNGNHEMLESIHYGWTNIDRKTRDRIYNRWFVETSLFPGWLPPALFLLVIIVVGVPVFRRLLRQSYDIES